MMADFKNQLEDIARDIEQLLARLIDEKADGNRQLAAAMRHGALGGGKRLRPFLLISSAALFGVEKKHALHAAAALECVHCYSLIHDDLPAMDDDDLRRAKPTVHIAFDEASAILAGDGLLTLGFEILGDAATHQNPEIRCELVSAMARAGGACGMIGGQMDDLAAENKALAMEQIIALQKLKTGALMEYACAAGAILGRADKKARDALHGFAGDLGLAFQITDDLLDHEGADTQTGKRTGKDQHRGKATFVSLLGAPGARNEAQLRIKSAIAHLEYFDEKAAPLRDLAEFVLRRKK